MTIDKALRIVRNPQVSIEYPSQNYGKVNNINFNSDRNIIAEKVIQFMPFDTSGVWNFIKNSGLVSKFFNWLSTVVGPVFGWLSKIVCEGAFTYLLAGVGNAFLNASRNLPQKYQVPQQNYNMKYNNESNLVNHNKPIINSNGSGFVSNDPVNRYNNLSSNPASPPSWLGNPNLANKFNF